MEPAFSSDDRSMNLQNKFQQVHGEMNYSLYLLFWLQARPRRFSFKTWAHPNADPIQNRPRGSRTTPRSFLICRPPEVCICITRLDSVLWPVRKWLRIPLFSRSRLFGAQFIWLVSSAFTQRGCFS